MYITYKTWQNRIRTEAYKLILFFSRNMHLYLYTAEDVDKVQHYKNKLAIYVLMSKMITNAIRWCHKFTYKRKLFIVLSFVFVH